MLTFEPHQLPYSSSVPDRVLKCFARAISSTRKKDLLEDVQVRGEFVLKNCIKDLGKLLDDPCLEYLIGERRVQAEGARHVDCEESVARGARVKLAYSSTIAYECDEVAAISIRNREHHQ